MSELRGKKNLGRWSSCLLGKKCTRTRTLTSEWGGSRFQNCEGLLRSRPGQEGARLRTGAPGSVQNPEMIEDRPGRPVWGGQGLILRVLDLCPSLGEISELGSTMRDLHAHPGLTALLPLPCHLPPPLVAWGWWPSARSEGVRFCGSGGRMGRSSSTGQVPVAPHFALSFWNPNQPFSPTLLQGPGSRDSAKTGGRSRGHRLPIANVRSILSCWLVGLGV